MDAVSRLAFLFCSLRGRSLASADSSFRDDRDTEAWRGRSCACGLRRLVVLGPKGSEGEADEDCVHGAATAGPVGVAVVDPVEMSYTVRGSTGTASTVTSFSTSEFATSGFRGLLGLLMLDLLCTPSRRSSEVAERAAEPPKLNRLCQLERCACPFFSGEEALESAAKVWSGRGLSTVATLLDRLRRAVTSKGSREFLLDSSLSGTGGSTAPCPCGSLAFAGGGPRGTKGAARAIGSDEDKVESGTFGEGVSRRGLLRERTLRSIGDEDEVWAAVACTNMIVACSTAGPLLWTERGAIGGRRYASRRCAVAAMRISQRCRSGRELEEEKRRRMRMRMKEEGVRCCVWQRRKRSGV